MDSLLVPSSIQRIRSFLVEMCGMKVKPWASTEETLAALHSTLVARYRCGIFWDSLRTLLENLARDLKKRTSATPGTLIDNEVLDGERYARLLDEIRQGLARQEAEATARSFRHLSAALSAPALGLLLFLGGAASVGCERSGLKQAPDKPDAALAADTNGAEPDSATSTLPDTHPPLDTRANLAPDTRPATPPDTRPDTPADGPPRIEVPPNPDTVPGPDAVTHGPDGATVTIQDVMDSCNLPKATQDQVLACLARLRDSWRTGMAQSNAGAPCAYVTRDLECFASVSQACVFGTGNEFVVGQTRICDPIIIYAGVRFV